MTPHDNTASLQKGKGITALDILLGLLLLGFAVYLARRVVVDLDYNWEWPAIFQYLIRYDEASGKWVANLLVQGLFTTIRLSIWGALLALVIGGVMGLAGTSERFLLKMLSRTYVELVRNLPPLVLVFIFYYFIGNQFLGLFHMDAVAAHQTGLSKEITTFLFAPPQRLGAFVSAFITLGIFEGAYITEIVRAGVQSIDKGQWEAARALGMTNAAVMVHVILPQSISRILPPLAGQFISTIKDSAIMSVISIQELTFQGMELVAATYLTFEVWITITLLYFMLTFGLSLAFGRLETHFRAKRG